jgi:hypothetical protein
LISASARDDIAVTVGKAPFPHFKPLLFVIPYAGLDPSRVEEVPRHKRASMEPEYIIRDLKMSEFGIVEL